MKLVFYILFSLTALNLIAQQNRKDSLLAVISRHRADTNEVNAISHLMDKPVSFDSMINFARNGLELAKRLDYKKGEADCCFMLSNAYLRTNNFSKGIEYAITAMDIYQQIKDIANVLKVYFPLQGTYRDIGDYKKSLQYAFSGLKIAETYNITATTGEFDGARMAPFLLAEIGQTYLLMNKLDSALYYTEQAINQERLFMVLNGIFQSTSLQPFTINKRNMSKLLNITSPPYPLRNRMVFSETHCKFSAACQLYF